MLKISESSETTAMKEKGLRKNNYNSLNGLCTG